MEYVASQAHYGKLACKRLLLYKLEVEVPKIFFQSFMYPKKQQPISVVSYFFLTRAKRSLISVSTV